MLELKVGDHLGDEPASYTRFVLPFRYHLENLPEEAVYDAVYLPHDVPHRMWRERYLTVETADALFHRGRWLRLETNGPWEWQVDLSFSSEKKIAVAMARPWLVLFEWPKNPNLQTENSLLQTGFLLVDLYFPTTDGISPGLEDLLRLNELFRYWQRPWEGHEKNGYRALLASWPLDRNRATTIGAEGIDFDDIYFERWKSLLEPPIRDEKAKVWRLFSADWSEKARASIKAQAKTNGASSEGGWIVYADSRTFVWTCAIVGGGAGALKRAFPLTADDGERVGMALGDWEAHRYGHWVKLLNVDLPKDTPRATHESVMAFERNWAKDRTYHRWEEWGTYYGFSYHGGAMLGPPETNPPLWQHFAEMYFDQVLLLLYLRVSLFRFSIRLNEISGKARDAVDQGGKETWLKEFRELRWDFALFTNLYQFPLLSNQQQGLEMYSLARKIMDVDELFDEVQKEIHSSHDFLAVDEAHRTAQTTARLTVVATMGLAVGLAFSFLGMNILVAGEVSSVLELLIFAAIVAVFFVGMIHIVRRSPQIAKELESISSEKEKPGLRKAMKNVLKAVFSNSVRQW